MTPDPPLNPLPPVAALPAAAPLFGVRVLSCAVKSNKGKRCQNLPSRVVRIDGGDEIMLCPRCYENACAGVYGDVSVIPVREISSPNLEVSERP